MRLCPVLECGHFSGINSGFLAGRACWAAGRACWAAGGTYCGGGRQGRADEEISACRQCGFYNDVMRAKGGWFMDMRSFAEGEGEGGIRRARNT